MEEAKSVNIFDNCICLAPMVRAGSLPLRSLCLKYGATLVWGEEIIDKRIRSASRVVNTELNTIDFIVDENVLVFRTAEVEKGKVVFQMGTSDPVVAVEAAKVVANDVAVIDINMGCPKRFSMQGGMGAALLQQSENACSIIKALRDNLTIPVTAKIRLLDTVEETVSFMQNLERAGVSAITVHMRTKEMESDSPALWDKLTHLVQSVNVPVIANGDIYTHKDRERIRMETKCAGIMSSRGVLLNASLLISPERGGPHSLREVIRDFLIECVKYHPPYQVVKYTIQEMMSLRRHNSNMLIQLKKDGIDFGRKIEAERVYAAKSFAEMCNIFEIPCETLSNYNSSGINSQEGKKYHSCMTSNVDSNNSQKSEKKRKASNVLQAEYKFDDAYFNDRSHLGSAEYIKHTESEGIRKDNNATEGSAIEIVVKCWICNGTGHKRYQCPIYLEKKKKLISDVQTATQS